MAHKRRHHRPADRAETGSAPADTSGQRAPAHVLLALPTTGEIHVQTLGSLQAMMGTTRRAADVTLAWENIRPVAECRNQLVRDFLADESRTHMLFVDTDMVVPPHGLDTLLATEAPLVCGPAPICRRIAPPGAAQATFLLTTNIVDAQEPGQRGQPIAPDDPHVQYVRREYGSHPAEPFYCDASGLSFCLIAREVLERIEPPWFAAISVNNRASVGEDVYFFRKARQAGYRLLVHPEAMCDHLKAADLTRFEQLLVPNPPAPRWAGQPAGTIPPTMVVAATRDHWLDLSTAECLLCWQADPAIRAGVRIVETDSPAWALARFLNQPGAQDPYWQRLLLIGRGVVPTHDVLARLAAIDAPIVTAMSRTVVNGQTAFNFALRDPATGELQYPPHLPMADLTRPFEAETVDLACTLLRRDTWQHVSPALHHAIDQPDPERAFCGKLVELVRAATGRKPVVAPLLVERRGDVGLLGLLQLKQRLNAPAAVSC